MKRSNVELVKIYYQGCKKNNRIFIGRLAKKQKQIFFEYDKDFLDLGLELSPFKLPLQPGVLVNKSMLFEGLFGVFNDSLPDGWGRLLLDRALIKYQINPSLISPLDRLCYVGSSGMGALTYEPTLENNLQYPDKLLDEIAAEVREFQASANDQYVEDLLRLGGGSAGARPKVLLNIDNTHWLIKFPSSIDPQDIGAIEYAYYLMAIDAGLDMSECKLFPAKVGGGYFATKRFDIDKNNQRIHMHTISGLLNADHRIPSLDYNMIIKAAMHLTRNMCEVKKIYRQAVFNVLSHNRDDHAKNFSFLMDANGSWYCSPAYDLTFSSGPNGEHCSIIMGEGQSPNQNHLLSLAQNNNVEKAVALEIITEVKSAVVKWPEFASTAGVRNSTTKLIDSEIQNIVKNF